MCIKPGMVQNSVKTYCNIVSFRDLEQATNDAIAKLLSETDAKAGVIATTP